MEYARLGGSGLKVSKVCLGTNMFGASYVEDARAVAVVHAAAEQGINFIDTADMYNDGRSEEVVGKAIRGRRGDFVVATKGFSAMGGRTTGSSRTPDRGEPAPPGTDYIDLYLAHFWDPETPLEETLSALDDMVRQGKVRYVGCCNFSAWQVAEALGIAWERGSHRCRWCSRSTTSPGGRSSGTCCLREARRWCDALPDPHGRHPDRGLPP